MVAGWTAALCVGLFAGKALGSPAAKRGYARSLSDDPPTVTLDSATVTGVNNGSFTTFLGIPFAEPPTGELRFNLPRAIQSYNGSINATQYGYSCPQQTVDSPFSLRNLFNFTIPFFLDPDKNETSTNPPNENEDCLTVNVLRPRDVSTDTPLPVVVWIYGGGFERGNAGAYDDQVTFLLNRSVELEKPVLVVSMNYRVSAWGFLASQEVLDAGLGNFGLYDQYAALKWVKKYISNFGGDPSKITLWGQSAGAISISLQMLAFGGNSSDLFRGAFMQSGSPIPVGNITGGQMWYDFLASRVNCADSSDSLACLRQAPYEDLRAAIDDTPSYFSYQALDLAWTPRADGIFLQDNPQRLVQQGKITNTTFVTGDVDDEGTLFSLSSRNVTTDEEFRQYVSTYFLPGASEDELQPLWEAYPSDPSDGSPFNTSDFNDITPQYKRIAAFQGDAVFQAPRRWLLQHRSGQVKMWSYHSRRLKYISIIGSFHASDLELHLLDDYIVNFAHNFDPNTGNEDETWPEYTVENPVMYTFPIVGDPELGDDTYRVEPMQVLTNLSLAHPL